MKKTNSDPNESRPQQSAPVKVVIENYNYIQKNMNAASIRSSVETDLKTIKRYGSLTRK